MRFEGKRILVTGGAGFIGSNLVERLLKEGAVVTCLDNLLTGSLSNILPFMDDENFTFIEGDIRDKETCDQACYGKEVILHQAALGSVPRSIEDPLPTHEINSTGFINILKAAKEAGVKRFVYASSSSVYGDHKGLPKVEENIGTHLSPYAVSKYSNELYAKVFGELYGIETIGLRYFNVFGKNQDPDGAYAAVIPKFVKAILCNGLIQLHGDGCQSRDFTYIENVLEANMCAAETTNRDAINTIFNVAYGSNMKLIDLLHLLQEKINTIHPETLDPKVEHVKERAGDIKHSFADIAKAKNYLGYQPKISIEEGLDRTIAWYCEQMVDA